MSWAHSKEPGRESSWPWPSPQLAALEWGWIQGQKSRRRAESQLRQLDPGYSLCLCTRTTWKSPCAGSQGSLLTCVTASCLPARVLNADWIHPDGWVTRERRSLDAYVLGARPTGSHQAGRQAGAPVFSAECDRLQRRAWRYWYWSFARSLTSRLKNYFWGLYASVSCF